MITINEYFLKNRSLLENIAGILSNKYRKVFLGVHNESAKECEELLIRLSRAIKWIRAEDDFSYQAYLDAAGDVYCIEEILSKIVNLLDFKEEILIPQVKAEYYFSEFNLIRESLKIKLG